MFGQLPGEEEADSSLDLPRRDGGPLVVMCKTGRLSSNALEDIVDETVHDGHSFAGDPGVGMDLLQDLVDVDPIALLPALLPFLVPLGNVLLGLPRLFGSLSTRFRCHIQNAQ